MDNYEEIVKLFGEYKSIPSDMKSYGSKELMDLKEAFELHDDLVIGMIYPLTNSSNWSPYLEFKDKLKPSFQEIEKLLNDFQPSSDEQKEQKANLQKKNEFLKKIAIVVSGEGL